MTRYNNDELIRDLAEDNERLYTDNYHLQKRIQELEKELEELRNQKSPRKEVHK